MKIFFIDEFEITVILNVDILLTIFVFDFNDYLGNFEREN